MDLHSADVVDLLIALLEKRSLLLVRELLVEVDLLELDRLQLLHQVVLEVLLAFLLVPRSLGH